MKVSVYKSKAGYASDYIVVIGRHVFEMSADANMPNGVNIYLGTLSSGEYYGKPIPKSKVPKGVLKGIQERMR
jgi:hypothetical protein